MKKQSGHVIYSPSDLIRYLASPFASWLDRYNLENPGKIKPDEATEEETLLSRTGDEHEQSILTSYKALGSSVLEIQKENFAVAQGVTLAAIKDKRRSFIRRLCRMKSFAAKKCDSHWPDGLPMIDGFLCSLALLFLFEKGNGLFFRATEATFYRCARSPVQPTARSPFTRRWRKRLPTHSLKNACGPRAFRSRRSTTFPMRRRPTCSGKRHA